MSIHTLDPGFRLPGFFDQRNIDFISHRVTEILSMEYNARVIIPDASIKMEMQNQHEDRIGTISKMNQRVIMELVRSFRNYQEEIKKKDNWSRNIWNAYNYDPSLGIKPYDKMKMNDRARGMRFAMTF